LRGDTGADGHRRNRRTHVAPLAGLALGLDVLAGEGVEPGEGDALALVGALDAGLAEVVEDHVGESERRGVSPPVLLRRLYRRAYAAPLAGFGLGQTAVRRQAFDRERAGQADN